MANIIQTVLIRTDLFGDNTGLIAAQVAHIHAQVLMMDKAPDEIADVDFDAWKKAPYLFVKKVPNLETLKYYYRIAGEAIVPVHMWSDTVYIKTSPTQQYAFNTDVGISLGPTDSDKIKTVIGDLPLL